MTTHLSAQAVIAALDLSPHPEGGHFREIFRAPTEDAGRGAVTSIYFLLAAGEVSHWHRVDAVEIWNFHAGAPLELLIDAPTGPERHVLGRDLAAGERPQGHVPAGAWQAARSD
ncbi:MAG: cupin domain-containing protein [Rhodospirillales bacterium]